MSDNVNQMHLDLPHDVVLLPSEGKFYKNKKKSVKVGYLTAADENILASVGNLSGDQIITNLVRSKLYEPDIRPDEMLEGDLEAILVFLRNTSFGSNYDFTLIDPETDKKFEKNYSWVERKLNGGILKMNKAMYYANLGDPDNASDRSLFSKKVHREKNEEGSTYQFDEEELSRLIDVINNPSSFESKKN
jgi:hypothetical protein